MNLKFLKFVVILAFLQILCNTANALTKYGLQDVCGTQTTGQIQLKGPIWGGTSSSAILVPRNSYYAYTANRSCTVFISSNSLTYGMVVSVRKLDLRPNSVDKLTIRYKDTYDREKEFRNSYSYKNRDIDEREYKSYTSTTNLTITFSTGNSILGTSSYDGFELIVTSVSDSPCSYGTFRCDSRLCIANELKCDGHNHCGDRSDQYNCGSRDTDSTSNVGGIVGYAIVVIAVIVLLCALIAICSKNCNSTSTSTYSRRYSGPNTVYLPYPGNVQTSSYSTSSYVGGSSYYESTYDSGTAAPAYESTYTGDYAAPSYESTYAGDSAAPAYESTYTGDSAAPCYSAYN